MRKKKKLKGAEAFGFRVIVDKSLDQFSNQVLFPEKLEKANHIIRNLKWPDDYKR